MKKKTAERTDLCFSIRSKKILLHYVLYCKGKCRSNKLKMSKSFKGYYLPLCKFETYKFKKTQLSRVHYLTIYLSAGHMLTVSLYSPSLVCIFSIKKRTEKEKPSNAITLTHIFSHVRESLCVTVIHSKKIYLFSH